MCPIARERLQRMCADAKVSYNLAVGVLKDAVRKFPDPDEILTIGGATMSRVSYARGLARERGSEALEHVVWNYLVD